MTEDEDGGEVIDERLDGPPPVGVYLGDGVTAQFDGLHIVLSTPRDDGVDEVYLDDRVYRALRRYAESCGGPFR